MRIRKRQALASRVRALDATDALLFSQLPDASDLHLLELLELVPGDPAGLIDRIYRLAAQGLLEVREDPSLPSMSLLPSAPPLVLSLLPTEPPAFRMSAAAADPHLAITAVPEKPLPIAEMFRATGDLLRTTLTDEDADARARILGKMPRVTVADEDAEARARILHKMSHVTVAEGEGEGDPIDGNTPVRGFRYVG